MKFTYEGFNNVGQAKKGEIEAPDEGKAAELLRDDGIFAQKLCGEGEKLKTVLPGNDTAKSDMLMPWQEPAPSKPIMGSVTIAPDPVPQNKDFKEYWKQQRMSMPSEKPTIIIPAKEWKHNFKSNLKAIDEVLAYYEKSKDLPKFPAATIKAAKAAAVQELLKQAIMKAVAENR